MSITRRKNSLFIKKKKQSFNIFMLKSTINSLLNYLKRNKEKLKDKTKTVYILTDQTKIQIRCGRVTDEFDDCLRQLRDEDLLLEEFSF